MNKRGDFDNVATREFLYLVVFLAFFIILLLYVRGYTQQAVLWEDYYAKQLAHLIDGSLPDTTITMDVTQATRIAHATGKRYSDIFSIDNENKQISVSLRPGAATRFSYLSNKTVLDPQIKLLSGGIDKNTFVFHIA